MHQTRQTETGQQRSVTTTVPSGRAGVADGLRQTSETVRRRARTPAASVHGCRRRRGIVTVLRLFVITVILLTWIMRAFDDASRHGKPLFQLAVQGAIALCADDIVRSNVVCHQPGFLELLL